MPSESASGLEFALVSVLSIVVLVVAGLVTLVGLVALWRGTPSDRPTASTETDPKDTLVDFTGPGPGS